MKLGLDGAKSTLTADLSRGKLSVAHVGSYLGGLERYKLWVGIVGSVRGVEAYDLV